MEVGKLLKLPKVVAKAELRTDAVLLSVASKQVNPLELTVPREHCVGQAKKRKRAKHSELLRSVERWLVELLQSDAEDF